MGERSIQALKAIRNMKRKPVYRVQDGSQASPESLPIQQGIDPNNIMMNKNIEAKEKLLMNDKPMIQCPHCTKIFEVERLTPQRRYRNEFGLDVFECPDCHKNYKFEPTEYLKILEHIEKGNLPDNHIIKAAVIDDILPSEKMVIDYDRRPRAPLRRPAKLFAAIAFLLLVFVIFN